MTWQQDKCLRPYLCKRYRVMRRECHFIYTYFVYNKYCYTINCHTISSCNINQEKIKIMTNLCYNMVLVITGVFLAPFQQLINFFKNMDKKFSTLLDKFYLIFYYICLTIIVCLRDIGFIL